MTDEEKKKLTWYWDPIEGCIWDPRQILSRPQEVKDRVTPVSFYDWISLIEHPVSGCHIANDPTTNRPSYIEDDPPTEDEQLRAEREEHMSKLQSMDYIGTKIATGRATVDEYQEEIALMNALAVRINEIDALLGS